MKAQAITKTYVVCPHCETVQRHAVDHLLEDGKQGTVNTWDCDDCNKYYDVIIEGKEVTTRKVERVNNDKRCHVQYLLVHNETDDPKNNFFLMIDDVAYFGDQRRSYPDQVSAQLYRLNSGTCPSNWMGGRPFIGEDTDPHGIFKFVAMREAVTWKELIEMYGEGRIRDDDQPNRDVTCNDLSQLEAFEILRYFSVPTQDLIWGCPTTTSEIENELHYTDKSMTYLPGIFASEMKDVESEHPELPAPTEKMPSGVPLIAMGSLEKMDFSDYDSASVTLAGANFVDIPPSWPGSVEFEDDRPLTADTNYSCECGALFEEETVGDTCPVCQTECKVINVGNKLTDQSGDKGVVCTVVGDDVMPSTENIPVPEMIHPAAFTIMDDAQMQQLYQRPTEDGIMIPNKDRIVSGVIYGNTADGLLVNDHQPGDENVPKGQLIEVNLSDVPRLIKERLLNEEPAKNTLKVELRPGLTVELVQPTRDKIEELGNSVLTPEYEQARKLFEHTPPALRPGVLKNEVADKAVFSNQMKSLTDKDVRVVNRRTVAFGETEVKTVFTPNQILDRVDPKDLVAAATKKVPTIEVNRYQRGVPTTLGGELPRFRGIGASESAQRDTLHHASQEGRQKPIKAFGESEVRISASFDGSFTPAPAESLVAKSKLDDVDISSKIETPMGRIKAAMGPADDFVLANGVVMRDLGAFGSLLQPGGPKPDDQDGEFEPAEGMFNPMK